MVDRLKRAIGPYTRVVGITWVHSSSGRHAQVDLRAAWEDEREGEAALQAVRDIA